MDSLSIAGKSIKILPLDKNEQNGLWLELIANFDIGKFEFNGSILFLFNNKSGTNYTPLQLKKISERIGEIKNSAPVFFFDKLFTYERDRLIEQGVYFVTSNKYAFIPSLIINRKEESSGAKSIFYPSTQYILFHHLQSDSIDEKTIKELGTVVPYKYATIARSLKQLQQLGFIDLNGGKEKRIAVKFQKKELWEKAQRHIINPVKAVYFSAFPLPIGIIGNVSALSHYSMLAPEDIPTRVISSEQLSELKEKGCQLLPFEDSQRIEVWKYPPLGNNEYVDRLSLFLTLKNDKDPRIQKELETMINAIKW